jgi:predicted enzyme related to lactoylglutathione lyase
LVAPEVIARRAVAREEVIMANPFVWVELQSSDVKKDKDFYAKLFDWKLEDSPTPSGGGTYTMIKVGEGLGGGMMATPAPGEPSHWLPYVEVDDVASTTTKAKELGAKVCVDVMKVGDMGTMSVIADPTGATLGLWQSAKK